MKMLDMCYALTDFCIEQNSSDNYSEDSIAVMAGELLDYCDRCIGPSEIAADQVYRYRIFTYGRENENVIPQNIRDNERSCSLYGWSEKYSYARQEYEQQLRGRVRL